MNYKKILLIILVFIGAFSLSTFLRGNGFFEKLFPEKTTAVRFDRDMHDFEVLKAQNPVSVYFKYTNTGDNPLIIHEIVSSCGCTAPDWSSVELHPEEADSILVVFDAAQTGHFNRSIHVYSNAVSSPDVLYIKGEVVAE